MCPVKPTHSSIGRSGVSSAVFAHRGHARFAGDVGSTEERRVVLGFRGPCGTGRNIICMHEGIAVVASAGRRIAFDNDTHVALRDYASPKRGCVGGLLGWKFGQKMLEVGSRFLLRGCFAAALSPSMCRLGGSQHTLTSCSMQQFA